MEHQKENGPNVVAVVLHSCLPRPRPWSSCLCQWHHWPCEQHDPSLSCSLCSWLPSLICTIKWPCLLEVFVHKRKKTGWIMCFSLSVQSPCSHSNTCPLPRAMTFQNKPYTSNMLLLNLVPWYSCWKLYQWEWKTCEWQIILFMSWWSCDCHMIVILYTLQIHIITYCYGLEIRCLPKAHVF